ncbi:MAG: TIGR03915 family putative DNA repair protein [Christensenellaceae bacterium]
MIYYVFDGSKEGLLCCIYHSFVDKEIPELVTSKPFQLTFDLTVKKIDTDAKVAERVRNGIIKNCSITLLNRIFYLFISDDASKETVMFNVARKCLEQRKDVSYNYADPDVLLLFELQQKISFEVHRFTGFLRFNKSASGFWYAHFEPDNDVVDIVAKHFYKRFSEPFLIHDVKRNKVALRQGKNMTTAVLDAPLTVYLDENDEYFESLYKAYYDSVNIKERKNVRLMRRYMPRRYYKHLPEKKPDKTFN